MRNRPGPISPPTRRLAVKKNFLEHLAHTNNIRAAARRSGINRWSVYCWLKSGYVTRKEMREAEKRFLSYLRDEWQIRNYVKDPFGTVGPVIEHGRVCDPPEGPLDYLSDAKLLRMCKYYDVFRRPL
jgi:hypothetical protein